MLHNYHLLIPGNKFLKALPLIEQMKTSFLDYYKVILDKVSFNKDLLKKEYSKAMMKLPERDKRHLDLWMRNRGLNEGL